MEFYFEPNDVSTMDERAMAIFSSDSTRTAIAKKEALSHSDGGNALFSNGKESLNACYTFAERTVPFKDVELIFHMEIIQAGMLDLISLRHGGYIRLLHDAIAVHFVTETGEFTAESSGTWNILGSKKIRLQYTRGQVLFEIGDTTVRIDVPDNCGEGLEMIGLFGEVSNMQFEVSSIAINDFP